MTIPKDHISFNDDDGTAWWIVKPVHRMGVTNTVGDDYYDSSWFMSLDRVCGTCDGLQQVRDYCSSGDCDDSRCTLVALHCPDCIDGRHTFTIEVEWCNSDLIGAWETKPYRVSVIPGMVLPIVDTTGPHQGEQLPTPDYPCAISTYSPRVFNVGSKATGWERITLPPAAEAGIWAVKLKVAQ